MIPTYKVRDSMGADQAKEKLQKAIDHLAHVYSIVGTVTIAESLDSSGQLRELLDLYPKAARMLEDLADDEIPF
jgi:hypothetical protein